MLPGMTRRRVLAAIAIAVGLALLAWQVRATGAANIARGMGAVGWGGAAGILFLSFLRFVARSTGWSALIPVETPPGRALGAMIAGEAAGSLTPLALFVSEPAKAAYLGSSVPSIGTAGALASLAAETFFFGISVAIYVMAGAAALLYAYPVDTALRAAGLVALGGMAMSLLVAGWMAWRKPTVVGALLSRAPIRRVARLADRVRAFERTAYGTTAHASARLGVVISAATLFHVFSFLELWLTLWLITGESHAAAAFILDTVGRLTNVLFKVIPLQLGVLQVGSELVARAIGLAPGVGVTVSLVRTIRVMAWTGLGLALLGKRGFDRSRGPRG
jgi:predicted membrane channel-forming protein YqfA (hemolysin III family)